MESSLVIKVQYGETLRRFSSRVVDGKLDIDINALREKISSLFSFSAGSELDFTYVDEDGDVVKLADEEDLHDIMRQSLNPLRITVKINTERSASLRPEGRLSGNSTPLRSPQLQFPLQVENATVSEVLNSLPRTIRETVSKFSTESGVDKNSPAGYLVVLDSLAKMGLTYLKEVSVAGEKSRPSESSTDAQLTKDKNSSISVWTKDKKSSISVGTTAWTKDENGTASTAWTKDENGSASTAWTKDDNGTASTAWTKDGNGTASAAWTKDGNGTASASTAWTKDENGTASTAWTKDENSSASTAWTKDGNGTASAAWTKDGNGTASAAWTKDGNGTASAAWTKDGNGTASLRTTQVSEVKNLGTEEGHVAGNFEGFVMPAMGNASAKDKSSILLKKTAPNSINEMQCLSDSISQENKGGKNSRSGPKMKLVKKSYESHPGWNSVMDPKPLNGIDSPSSGLPVPPYLHRHQLPHCVAPVRRSYNHSDVMASVFHTGIQCDGCGVHPISGPRFKSKVKEDYDLCIFCFNSMGVESEYIRMDLPMNYQGQDPLSFCDPHRLGRRPTLSADHVKLDSCFILDVNILDGTIMTPLTNFTKIWRMRNNGVVAWPHGTNLLWIGGDKLSKTHSCDLKIPAEGCPVDKEIDIAVDFTAPENPGRYISYWRMASPSGQKFGQRVWVLIQVDSSLKASNIKNHHDFNLNFPPASSGVMGLQNEISSIGLKTGDDLIEIDTPAKDQGASVEPKIGDNLVEIDNPTIDQGLNLPNPKPDSAKPQASSAVTYPVVDQSKVEPVAISVQNTDMDVPSSLIDVDQGTNKVEQTLLKELENMGFTEVDLNKEVLRKNEYDLEATLNELCDIEWDPMLAELQEMGFANNEMNKMLLKKNNGSIKRVVMDLIAGEDE